MLDRSTMWNFRSDRSEKPTGFGSGQVPGPSAADAVPELLVGLVSVRGGLRAVDPPVDVVGGRVDRVDPQRLRPGVEEVVPRARGDDHGVAGGEGRSRAIED